MPASPANGERAAERSRLLGVGAAVFAAFAWALNFLSPYAVGNYTSYDFIGVRFIAAGMIGLGFVVRYRGQVRRLRPRDVLLAAGLGMVGYVGYLICIMGGVIYAGPVLTPAVLGIVPILSAAIGNLESKTLPWRKLTLPMALGGCGLFVANAGSLPHGAQADGASLSIGIAFSLGAVFAWVAFGRYNQRALERNPQLHSAAWTGLMMAGAGFCTLLLVPFGLWLSAFNLPSVGFGWTNAKSLYASALALAAVSSFGGAWAWNAASKRLPMVLTGQLISIETVFAAAFGLCVQQRWPSINEAAGVSMVLMGAVIAVRLVLVPAPRHRRKAA